MEADDSLWLHQCDVLPRKENTLQKVDEIFTTEDVFSVFLRKEEI